MRPSPLFILLLLLISDCAPSLRPLREKATEKIPADFILVRVSGADCINCLGAYQHILSTLHEKQLDSCTIILAGNLPAYQQDEFFNSILGDNTHGKAIVNDDTLFYRYGQIPASSVCIYKNNRKVYETAFADYNDMDFRRELYSSFGLQNSVPISLKGDSTGFFRKHYADEDYVLFRKNIYAFSPQFGKIYVYALPTGKALDSLRLSELTDQLDYSSCIDLAVSDDTGSIRLTHELSSSPKNYFTDHPSYPRFLLTNVSACDSFLCVSLYITYFMKTDDAHSYGVNKRPILLLLDEQLKVQRKLFFSRGKMGGYWTSDYNNLYYDTKKDICWKRIFLDSGNDYIHYTLGRFRDDDHNGIYDLDSMLFDIPPLFREKHLDYNFLTAGFLSTPDTLLYYYQMLPEIRSLPEGAATRFPQIDMSQLSADYKHMKFVLPFRALDLAYYQERQSYLLTFETGNTQNRIYEWRSAPGLFREYTLPDGRISKTFLVDNSIVSLQGTGTYRKIKYFPLPE